MTKQRLFEVIGGVFSIVIVLSMITFIIISLTVTKGYYSYYEVELKTSEYGYVYAVVLDSESQWEKQNITDCHGDRYKVTGFYKSSTLTLIGRFYEGLGK